MVGAAHVQVADEGAIVRIERGVRVRIPQGATVRTMHPSRDSYVLKRSQVVKVDHTLGGTPAYPEWNQPAVPLTVRWPGTGGYWCETTEFEIIEGT